MVSPPKDGEDGCAHQARAYHWDARLLGVGQAVTYGWRWKGRRQPQPPSHARGYGLGPLHDIPPARPANKLEKLARMRPSEGHEVQCPGRVLQPGHLPSGQAPLGGSRRAGEQDGLHFPGWASIPQRDSSGRESLTSFPAGHSPMSALPGHLGGTA